MESKVVIILVSHWDTSPLNDDAPFIMKLMDVTRLVFHTEMLPLNADAPLNMKLISTT